MTGLHGRIEPPNKPVMGFRAYPDTFSTFLPIRTMLTTEKKRLIEAYGAKPLIRVHPKLGYMMIPVQCPQPDCLGVLNEIQAHYGGVVSRLDIAFEAVFDPLMSNEEQMQWIKAHLLLKHRSAQPVLELKNGPERSDNGVFFVPHAHTDGAPRDICLYGDRASKLDLTIKRVARFELRLRTKEAFGTPYRNNKPDFVPIETANDVIRCDPSEIAKRHIRFADIDMDQFRRKLFADQLKNRTAAEARRAISNLKRNWNEPEYQLEYVQRIHDRFSRLPLITNNSLVGLPNRMTWGAQRRSQSNRPKNID